MRMDWKTLLFRLLLLVLASAGGMTLLALVFNGFVLMNLMPQQIDGQGFGYVLLQRNAYVMIGAIAAGFIAIFIRPSWRNALLFAPLYAPTVFAIVFILTHQGADAAAAQGSTP